MRSSSKLHSGPTERKRSVRDLCCGERNWSASPTEVRGYERENLYRFHSADRISAGAYALLTRFVIVEMRGRLNFTVRMLKGCYRARVSAKEPSVNGLSREGDIIAQEYLDNGTPRMPRENKRENKRVMITSALGEGKGNFFFFF